MMNREAIRSGLLRVGEGIVVVALALVFFSLFLGLLRMVFPSGSSVKDATKREAFLAPADLADRSVRDLLFASGGDEPDTASDGHAAAVLTRTKNSVKSKRMDAIAWAAAREGLTLYARDAVQTFSRSQALIDFDDRSSIAMGENSLVIIRRFEQDPTHREKRSFLVMVDGELRGTLGPSDRQSAYLEVALPGGLARIQSSRAADGEAEFKITVQPDQSSTIAVYRGAAEVVGNGHTVRVEANQSSTVALGQAPTAPIPLPAKPALTSPAEPGLFAYRDLPPRIRFAWTTAEGGGRYRFVLAKDRDFNDVVNEERLSSPTFTHGNLKHGEYYWRVSAWDGEREGPFSDAGTVRVVADREPPTLDVRFPPKATVPGRYTLSGTTEPDARVFIGGEAVTLSKTGGFSYPLQIRQGVNVIVVEAIDEAGNVAYRSELVNGKS